MIGQVPFISLGRAEKAALVRAVIAKCSRIRRMCGLHRQSDVAGCGKRGQAPLKPVFFRARTAFLPVCLSACDAQADNAQAGDAEPDPCCHGFIGVVRTD